MHTHAAHTHTHAPPRRYNQGVILSGLSQLSVATGNATLLAVAERITAAVATRLSTPQGILVEPCSGTCDNDQRIFKVSARGVT